jgi:hypothetical protein
MKKFYPDEEVTKESIGTICTDDSIKSASLKNVPLNSRFIINNRILITLNDETSINYREFIDLRKFQFDTDYKFICSLDFVGWITILEEEIYSLSADAKETNLKFISPNELEMTILITCVSIADGYESILKMHEKVYERASKKFDEYEKKFRIDQMMNE